MPNPRQYENTHPWITFAFNAERHLGGTTWAHLGEAYAECAHLMGTPLDPIVAQSLAQIYIRRGALASAAIEGNTLTEEDVEDIFVHNRHVPESQQYLEQEVRNVLDTLEEIRKEVSAENPFGITPHYIASAHAQLLERLDTPDHVSAGQYRTISVGVGNYRGAPAEDVPYLMNKLCEWITSIQEDARSAETSDRAFFLTFFAATLAHLYIAWIHPFGDGNGRLARIIECSILAHSGLIPWITTNVLSDFYNKTRSQYYEKLDAASRDDDIAGFIAYSALGLRDQLRNQVETVQLEQRTVAWTNYVHRQFHDEPSTQTTRRRREVALAMPEGISLERKEIRYLNPDVSEMYEQTSDRLFRRDMGKLVELGLIRETSRGRYETCVWRIDSFLPLPDGGRQYPATLASPREPTLGRRGRADRI